MNGIWISLALCGAGTTAGLALLCLHLRREAAAAAAALQQRDEALRRSEAELRDMAAREASLAARLEEARKRLDEERARQQLTQEERQKADELMRTQFKSLAADILGEQSRLFRESNRESIDGLLKPFKQNIADFRERVEKIHTSETAQYGELKTELKNLMELNRRITTETTNLTRALKGDSKVQGDYGEMVLDTILSNSNLQRGVHYTVQESFQTEEGNRVQPDVVLQLPDKKQIVIDSKTSLTAFVDYTAAEEPDRRKTLLKAHLDSVRKHVAELAAKSYQTLLNGSPDFVIMFIPNESAFLAAMHADADIWADAYRRKVIVSSPTNLFALLKLVDNLWQRSDLERNTRDIAECGSKLYDQLVLFADSMQDVEKGLRTAQRSYDEAYKRFTTGNNNLVRLGERMAGLHVKIKKQMPQNVLNAAELDHPDRLPQQPDEEE